MLYTLLNLFIPRLCPLCGKRMEADDFLLCSDCFSEYRMTGLFSDSYENSMAKSMLGHIYIERANALFLFTPHSGLAPLIYSMKYKLRPDIGILFGRLAGEVMQGKGFFDGIDFIVPVPLTRRRRWGRGYNQAEMFAKGLSEITGIPVATDVVARKSFQKSQTRLKRWDRRANVEDAFVGKQTERMEGKHVLLVDDVFTTGATMAACAKVFAGDFMKEDSGYGKTKVSILSIGYAGKLTMEEEIIMHTLDYFNSEYPDELDYLINFAGYNKTDE